MKLKSGNIACGFVKKKRKEAQILFYSAFFTMQLFQGHKSYSNGFTSNVSLYLRKPLANCVLKLDKIDNPDTDHHVMNVLAHYIQKQLGCKKYEQRLS